MTSSQVIRNACCNPKGGEKLISEDTFTLFMNLPIVLPGALLKIKNVNSN